MPGWCFCLTTECCSTSTDVTKSNFFVFPKTSIQFNSAQLWDTFFLLSSKKGLMGGFFSMQNTRPVDVLVS